MSGVSYMYWAYVIIIFEGSAIKTSWLYIMHRKLGREGAR